MASMTKQQDMNQHPPGFTNKVDVNLADANDCDITAVATYRARRRFRPASEKMLLRRGIPSGRSAF